MDGELANSFSQEFRLESDDSGNLQWMVGAYFANAEFTANLLSGAYFVPLGALGTPYYNADTPIANYGRLKESADTSSAFASASFRLSRSLRLNIGARYSMVHKEDMRELVFGSAFPIATFDTFVSAPEAVQRQIADGLAAEIGPFDDPTRTDRKLMPSTSLQYDITPQLMTYASYTSGFKAGGYALNSVKNAFAPETVDAYEIGLKGSVLGVREMFGPRLEKSRISAGFLV